MRKRQTSCCFSGHRPGKLPWGENENDIQCIDFKQRLRKTMENAYEVGYRHFICGMAMGSDLYFCEQALQMRQQCSDITVEAAVPFAGQSDCWPSVQRQRWKYLVNACDVVTRLQEKYTVQCMQQRNRYMIDQVTLLIAAYSGCGGGTQRTIQYAVEQGVDIIYVPPVLKNEAENNEI